MNSITWFLNKEWRKCIGIFAISFLLISCEEITNLIRPGNDGRKSQAGSDLVLSRLNTSNSQKVAFTLEKDRDKFCSWIIQEMYFQIYLHQPKSEDELRSWVNVFLQGGSLEGIYHGLILSSDYSALEQGTASIKAIRFFAEETALTQINSNDPNSDHSRLAKELVQSNLSAPLFQLKRILGEHILQQFNSRKNDPEKLMDWYAKTAVRWNGLGISFGIPERSSLDINYHRAWAKSHPLSSIEWELLNRVHRIMNEYGGVNLGGR